MRTNAHRLSWSFSSMFSSSLRSLLHSLTRLTLFCFPGVCICTTVSKWAASDGFHTCECSLLWRTGAPTGFFPSLSGDLIMFVSAAFTGLLCRVQRWLFKRWQLSKPLTCSLPVGTLYNLLLFKFLRRKMINVPGLKATCRVGFYSPCVWCNVPEMSVSFSLCSIHINSFRTAAAVVTDVG